MRIANSVKDLSFKNIQSSFSGEHALRLKNALNDYLVKNPSTSDKILDTYKALDTQNSTQGLELIDTILFRGIINKIDVFGQVAPLFPQMVMNSAIMEIPVELNQVIVTGQGESTLDTSTTTASSSTPLSNKATLTAKKLTAKSVASSEIEEDGVIDIVKFIIDSHAKGHAYALDDAILNGDTTNPHQDSNVSASGRDVKVQWKGLRKLALAGGLTVSAGGDAFAMADAFDAEQILGKYASNRNELAYIVSPKTYLQMVEVAAGTSNNNMISFNVTNGIQLLTLNGIRVIQSEAIKTNYNNSGVYDGTTTTKTYAILVNTQRFLVGTRSELQFNSDVDYDTDQKFYYSRVRKAFSPVVTPSATESSVALIYNIL